jgi:hypothetical protein
MIAVCRAGSASSEPAVVSSAHFGKPCDISHLSSVGVLHLLDLQPHPKSLATTAKYEWLVVELFERVFV